VPTRQTLINRRSSVVRLNTAIPPDVPIVAFDNGVHFAVRAVGDGHADPPLIAARFEVVAAFVAGYVRAYVAGFAAGYRAPRD
jgi:hypothetical protein